MKITLHNEELFLWIAYSVLIAWMNIRILIEFFSNSSTTILKPNSNTIII